MKIYIAIDGGTTNTRVSLVCNDKITETIKIDIGARKSIEGSKPLKVALANAIDTLLSNNGLVEADVRRILASGMITSEFGLCKLDHIETPAGIEELSATTHETLMEEISDIPFVFVRGVRTSISDFSSADMMRGEETELMGIMHPSFGECIYVLPGSHTKVICCNEEGKIVDFSTLLTGEMTASLCGNTILKDAVDLSHDSLNEQYLLKGYNYTKENGINNALFKVRILKNLFGCTAVELYSFYMGIVLCHEVESILKYNVKKIVVGGKRQLRDALCMLLNHTNKADVIPLNDEVVETSVVRGLIKIYEN